MQGRCCGVGLHARERGQRRQGDKLIGRGRGITVRQLVRRWFFAGGLVPWDRGGMLAHAGLGKHDGGFNLAGGGLERAVHDGVVGHRVGEVADGMLGVFGMG